MPALFPSPDGRYVVAQEVFNDIPSRWQAYEIRNRELSLPLRRYLLIETEITWKGTDGRQGTGGLILPIGYEPGKRYPLVIQTHQWNPQRFYMDGTSTAGYAAQVLAAKGFVVVHAGLSLENISTTEEGPIAMASIEGLIDNLAGRGLIDRQRVGLLGWSRSGYHVRYTLTFSNYPIAAAIFADGMDASYMQYLSWVNDGGIGGEVYEQINGAVPFGEGLRSWLDHTTGFNLSSVHTPVRLLGFRKPSLLNNWEWFAGLQRLGKAVEFVWFPEAAHAPVRPAERLVIQGGTVDWFSFWLKREEEPDPTKAGQYERWGELRTIHEQNVMNDPRGR